MTKRYLIIVCKSVLYSLIFVSMNLMGTERPLIFPVPQQIKLTDGIFVLDETMSIVIPEDHTDNDLFMARFLVRELSDKYGIAVKIEKLADIPENRKVVVMGRFDNQLVNKYCEEKGIKINSMDPGSEGYILQVDPARIVIAGSDEPGAYFGLQSLRQMIDAGNGESVNGAEVRDWPNLPFRAIRLYVPGPENIAFFKRFLRDFMSLYKFNKVVIEINNLRLDNHPEVNAGWIEFAEYMHYTRSNSTKGLRGENKNSTHHDAGDGFIIEKEDVRDIVNYARENFIEVIPEIPTLSHAYYLLTRHPELAEYPGDIWPDTYCPSNPDTYKLLFSVFDEYIEVMKPGMIHIGHDEWWGAPLDVCPHCAGKDFSELFAQDINRIYDYMAGQGIKVAMWGDFLLESVRGQGPRTRTASTGISYQTPGGTRPEVVRESIPKDILIFNWFWRNQDRETELQEFGFKQVYGNFTPNISNWNERIKNIDVLGGVPSAWASTNEFNFSKDLIMDFLGSANLTWSNHTIDQKELIPIVQSLMPSIRSSLNYDRVPGDDGDPIKPVDISSRFNIPKDSKIFDINLSSLKSGKVQGFGKEFNLAISELQSGNCAVAVGTSGEGANPLPAVVKGIPVNEDVSSLIFLHASALPSENQKAYFNIPNFFDTADLLGWYEIIYEDGFKAIIPIQYGVNILEWNPGGEDRLDKAEGLTGSPQNVYAYKADPVICSYDSTEDQITFFAYEWVNPRFGKIIREINLHGTVNYQATQTNYGEPEYKSLKSNAIILAAINKVIKREPYLPR